MIIRDEPKDMGDHVIEYGVGENAPLFAIDRIVPIPSRRAKALVYIDGKYYCGFQDMPSAKTAVSIWRGDLDGGGRMTTTHYGEHWPAIVGRRVEVVPG